MRGTYVLEIELKKDKVIRVGKLGEFFFPAGCYLYVGSARGGIEKRIKRHLQKDGKKFFWHIDFFLALPEAEVKKVWKKEGEEECILAGKINYAKISKIPAPGFGARDCRCRTHFFLILKKQDAENLLYKNGFCPVLVKNKKMQKGDLK